MTEEEAEHWVAGQVDAAALRQLRLFASWVVEENAHQNLISPATVPVIWQRHIADSLQLLRLGNGGSRWLDIGSGGGFPGMVLAIAGAAPLTLVEPRKRRAAFLESCVERLNLSRVSIVARKIEQVDAEADVITARAVASVDRLIQAAAQCCTSNTRWLLPRGSTRLDEQLTNLTSMKMVFHVEQSLTQPLSSILILEGCPR